MILERYFNWWDKKLLKASLGFLVFTHIAQIPHFLWGGDVIVQTGYVYAVDPIYDIILYSIDLIEIPAIVIVVHNFIGRYTK